MLAPPLASTVSSVMSLGFTARETVPIVFFGFLICSVVITLYVLACIPQYALNLTSESTGLGRWVQPTMSRFRSSYDRHLACTALILPFVFEVGNVIYLEICCIASNILLAFVAAMWTAILCVQAADFLQNCLTAIWPSFANFPNHLPEGANITCKHTDG